MVFKPQTFHDAPPQAEIDNPTQAGLEARVAEALARAGTADASQVDVTVEGSVVTLTGVVGAAAEIGTVGDVAGPGARRPIGREPRRSAGRAWLTRT